MTLSYYKLIISYFIFLPIVGFISYSFLNIGPEIFSILILFIFFSKHALTKKLIVLNKYNIAYIIFIILAFSSKYVFNDNSFAIDVELRNFLIIIAVLLSMIFMESVNISEKNIRYTVYCLKILILLSLIVSIIQYFNETFFLKESLLEVEEIADENYTQRRIMSIFSWVNNLNMMIFSLPLILNIILGREYILYKNIKSYWVIVAVGLVCLLSQSRNFLLLYFIVTFYYLFKTLSVKNFIYIASGILLLTSLTLLIQFDFERYFTERLMSQSYLSRIEAYYAFMHTFPQNPIWGTGGIVTNDLLAFYGRKTRLHNGYFAILYYYGIIAGIAYFSFIILMFRRLNRHFKNERISIPMISFICIAVGNLFVDYYVLFDLGLFMTILFSRYIYNVKNKDVD